MTSIEPGWMIRISSCCSEHTHSSEKLVAGSREGMIVMFVIHRSVGGALFGVVQAASCVVGTSEPIHVATLFRFTFDFSSSVG